MYGFSPSEEFGGGDFSVVKWVKWHYNFSKIKEISKVNTSHAMHFSGNFLFCQCWHLVTKCWNGPGWSWEKVEIGDIQFSCYGWGLKYWLLEIRLYIKVFVNLMTKKGLISKVDKQLIQLSIKKNFFKWAENLNGHFSKEHTDGPTGMWEYAQHSNHQGNADQTTTRHPLTPVRITIITETINNKRWRGCGWKGALIHCWWECKLVQPLQKAALRFLKNLQIELTWSSHSPPGCIYPKETCGF